MHRHILVPFLEATVLTAPVKVIATDDYSSLHLRRDHHTLKDSAANRDIASERTLFVDVRALRTKSISMTAAWFLMARLNRCLGCLESQTNISDVAPPLPATLSQLTLAPDKDGILFLVRFFRLFGLPVLVCSGGHISQQPQLAR